MGKGNPNAPKVKQALIAMLNDKEAIADITARAGNYNWLVGDDLSKAVRLLRNMIKKDTLKDLIFWQDQAFGLEVVYKETLSSK
jgi:hypothetical protein